MMITPEDKEFIARSLRSIPIESQESFFLELFQEGKLKNGILSGVDLSSIFFNKAFLVGADLSRTIFNDTFLTDADLSYTDLQDAELIGAKLNGAILGGANLSRAFLSHAELINANLDGAILNQAILKGANLTRTLISHADLIDTDLSEAICQNTIFADVDLSTVKGLETIHHNGPSQVDIYTLYRSKGKIPEVFLRGCGVPENLITFLPSLIGNAIDLYSCFISYSRENLSFAQRLHDTLQGRGIRCWFDQKEMLPGNDIYTEIDRGIRHWDKILLCCSKSSLTNKWWVDHEIDLAFQKERDLMKARGEKVFSLIPLDLDGFLFSEDCNNPKAQQIRSRIAANFKGWEHDNAIFEREIEKVIKALRTDGGKEPPPQSKL